MNFNASSSDFMMGKKIAARAVALAERYKLDYPAMTAYMDIIACHANGMPLCLDMLLAADDEDFAHDVFGIRRHIDRETGQLQDCFMPRFAKVYHDNDEGAQA